MTELAWQRFLLVGMGITNRAVARALLAHGHEVVVVDDRPTEDVRLDLAELGLELVESPDADVLADLVDGADALVAAPGLPESHAVFALADRARLPSLSEFDLAAAWDDRPIVAITGTNGKTTVVSMVTEMLAASGVRAVDAGNTDIPLVAAIADPEVDVFVVEASSFRLARAHGWAPRVATWLNMAPDHLDVHASHDDYVAAKARIFAAQGADDVAIGSLDDPVVAEHLVRAPAGRRIGFDLSGERTEPDGVERWTLHDDHLVDGDGNRIVARDRLVRSLDHDVVNALAAAATATAAGATRDAIDHVLGSFGPLPHRVFPVATIDDVAYYDDSKSTVPASTAAAVAGLDSVVLIAGGRNKGLDLNVLAADADNIRAVVAIGEAAPEVAAAFDGVRPVEIHQSMEDAVAAARRLAEPGDAVLLSPACASFDWYPNYAARGDHFTIIVRSLEEST